MTWRLGIVNFFKRGIDPLDPESYFFEVDLQQPYFILVLAHSLHGRLRRIHVPYAVIYSVIGLAILGGFSLFGIVSSYVRMVDKTSNYNDLRDEVSNLRNRYGRLQKENKAKDEQLATFQLYASEVSSIFGLKRKMEGPASIVGEAPLVPTLKQSLAEYSFLRTDFSRFRPGSTGMTGVRPSLWPVSGRLMSYFGKRSDPFSGEGAIHTGVDIAVPSGTAVRAAADGIVTYSAFLGGYGRIVMISHGAGCMTYYAHLSRLEVLPGQRIRRADMIGYSGASGRATAPHLHYEVRMNGVAVNPYPYLKRSAVSVRERQDFLF